MKKLSLIVLQLFAACAPMTMRARLLNRVSGWSVHPKARIGRGVLLLCDELKLEENSRIGSLTVVKGLSKLWLKSGATVGRLNWITGYPLQMKESFSHRPTRRPELIMERESAMTNRHIVDCTDSIRIGEFATVAGFASQLLTHSIDVMTNRQDCKPIEVGAYAFVGTRSVLLGGAVIPACTVVAAGSVVTGRLEEEYAVYGGVPARELKRLSREVAYFNRATGPVE